MEQKVKIRLTFRTINGTIYSWVDNVPWETLQDIWLPYGKFEIFCDSSGHCPGGNSLQGFIDSFYASNDIPLRFRDEKLSKVKLELIP